MTEMYCLIAEPLLKENNNKKNKKYNEQQEKG